MAALILAMRPPAASLSLVLSLEMLVLGVKPGETLVIEFGAEVVLEVDAGALLPLGPARLLAPLTLRKTSIVARLDFADCATRTVRPSLSQALAVQRPTVLWQGRNRIRVPRACRSVSLLGVCLEACC